MPDPQFKIGDRVNAIALVDCFGIAHATVSGLVVTRVTEQAALSMPPYFRIKAEGERGGVEGAERFFEFA